MYGKIVNLSSINGIRGKFAQSNYAASKAGIEYATQVAALEYGPDQVRINCIAPHLIETEMTAAIFEHKLPIEAIKMQTPLGRMGTPEDIANCALFLASDEAQFVSGVLLPVDGAQSARIG